MRINKEQYDTLLIKLEAMRVSLVSAHGELAKHRKETEIDVASAQTILGRLGAVEQSLQVPTWKISVGDPCGIGLSAGQGIAAIELGLDKLMQSHAALEEEMLHQFKILGDFLPLLVSKLDVSSVHTAALIRIEAKLDALAKKSRKKT